MIKLPSEIMQDIAASARARRLALNLTQEGLRVRSGVSLGTIKKFERTGKISLESLLTIAMALGATREFESLFPIMPLPGALSLDALLKQPQSRKRGRVT